MFLASRYRAKRKSLKCTFAYVNITRSNIRCPLYIRYQVSWASRINSLLIKYNAFSQIFTIGQVLWAPCSFIIIHYYLCTIAPVYIPAHTSQRPNGLLFWIPPSEMWVSYKVCHSWTDKKKKWKLSPTKLKRKRW